MPQELTYHTPKTDWNINTPIGDADLNRIETNMQLMTPLGVPLPYFFNFLPDHHLWCDGKTIGDQISGATARADADVFSLFEGLWNSWANEQLPIQNSDGTAGTRGSSALADFNAHMRLPLPDLRGRTLIGMDNMGGTLKKVVVNPNANMLGGTGGEENHALATKEGPIHNHSGSTGTDYPDHAHVLAYIANGEYPATHSTVCYGGTTSNAYQYTGGANQRHYHSITINNNNPGGVAHNNMQPWMACNYIIRY